MKLYAVRNGKTFYITTSKGVVWENLRRGLKVTVVEECTEVSDVPLSRIVGKIGGVWYISAEDQEIR